jgi:hypothetical protein
MQATGPAATVRQPQLEVAALIPVGGAFPICSLFDADPGTLFLMRPLCGTGSSSRTPRLFRSKLYGR